MYPDVLLSLPVKLFEIWRDSYNKRPVLTAILTIILAVILSVTVYTINARVEDQRRAVEAERLANLDLNKQVQELDRVQVSLQNLIAFVEDQRNKVTAEQETIAKLARERAQLEPIVQQDRAVIEGILALQAQSQAQQAEQDKWFERGFGFVAGVIGSMIASFLFALVTNYRRKPASDGPPSTQPDQVAGSGPSPQPDQAAGSEPSPQPDKTEGGGSPPPQPQSLPPPLWSVR